MIGREQLAGAPKTGGDLIEDEQQAVPVRHLPQHCQAFGRVGVHAAGTLEDRFDDDRGQLPGMRSRDVRELGCPRLHGFRGRGSSRRGTGRKHVAGQQAREGGVHAVHGIADAHRREGVAVVSAADAEEPLPLRVPGRGLELHRQLQRNLHGHRTRVRKEHPLQTRPSGRGRGHVHQPLGKFHRRGMREAAEHHMAETLQLPLCGGVQHRVAVAVDHRPPRGHRIHHLMAGAVLAPKPQPHAVGRLDLPQRKVRGRRRVRVPQPCAVPLDQARLRLAAHGASTPWREHSADQPSGVTWTFMRRRQAAQ